MVSLCAYLADKAWLLPLLSALLHTLSLLSFQAAVTLTDKTMGNCRVSHRVPPQVCAGQGHGVLASAGQRTLAFNKVGRTDTVPTHLPTWPPLCASPPYVNA